MEIEEVSPVDELHERGYCYIDNVIPPAEVGRIRDSVRADVMRHNDSQPPKDRTAVRGGKVGNLLRFNQTLAPYLVEERFRGVIDAALGPRNRISFFTGFVTPPGAQRARWHADWPYDQGLPSHIPTPYPDVALHLTTFWMLSDFRPDNGATHVMPRSHRLPDHPRDGAEHGDPRGVLAGETQLIGKAGTVAVCDSRLWHASAANTSRDTRVAVVVRFAAWWLNLNFVRPSSSEYDENSRLFAVDDLSPTVYGALPDAVKPLARHLLPPAHQP